MPRTVHPRYAGALDKLVEERTAEERLLGAIFGAFPEEEDEMCTRCGRVVKRPIYFENQPYHPKCLEELGL